MLNADGAVARRRAQATRVVGPVPRNR